VLGDPVGFVDPTGEFAIPLILPFVPLIKTGVEALIYTTAGYLIFDTLDDDGNVVCEAQDSEPFDPTSGRKRKHPKTGESGWEDNDGLWSKERAGDRGHGGSAWKKWRSRRDWEKGKPREGTYDKDGTRLRD